MVAVNYAPTLAPTAGQSPETIALQQEYAKHLLAGSDQPIHSWSQGVAGIVDALVGGTMARKAGERQAAGEASANDAFTKLLMGGNGGSSTLAFTGEPNPAGASGVPSPQASTPSSPDTSSGGDISGLAALPMTGAAGGAAPAVTPPAAAGAPAAPLVSQAQIAALMRNPFATPAQKAMALELWKAQMPKPPEYGFETVDGQLVRTNKTTGGAEPIYSAPTKPSNDFGDYQKDKTEGYAGTFQDWQKERDARRRQVLSPEEQASLAENEARNKETVAHFGELAKDLPAADQLAQGVDQLEGLLQGVDTGSEAAVRAWVAENTGLQLGEGTGKLQAISSLVDYMAPRMRVSGSGSSSDRDVAMFRSSLPSLIRSPEGNKLIIDTMRSMAEHRIAVAQISEDYLTGAIEKDDALAKMRDLPDPMADFKKAAPPVAPAVSAPAIQTPSEQPPSGVDSALWPFMTPEERALFKSPPQPAAASPVPPMRQSPEYLNSPMRARPND